MSEHPQNTGEVPQTGRFLYLTPIEGQGACNECFCHFDGVKPGKTDLLLVTITKTPRDRMEAWRQVHGTKPANYGIVSISDQRRSTAQTQSIPMRSSDQIRTVSNPGDLTGIGIGITEFLSEWADNDNRPMVCFESLPPLLQYTDVQNVYRFIHHLTNHLEQADAIAHFHAPESGLEETAFSTLAQLFDDIIRPVELDEDRSTKID